jgi:hypothetical protein
LLLLVRNGERHFLPGRDVDVHEGPRDVRVPETAPEVAITKQLPPVALDAITREPQSLRGEVRRLELLDQPRALGALDASVEPSREHGGPVFDGNPRLEMDLAAVGRVSVASRRENAGVDFGPHAETPPPVSAIEADSTKALVFGELADVDLERPGGPVEFHGKRCPESRRKKKKSIGAIIISRC